MPVVPVEFRIARDLLAYLPDHARPAALIPLAA